MTENILIDPRFAKPANVVGLEDPEEGVTAAASSDSVTSGLPNGTGTGNGTTTGGNNNPGNETPSFAAPTFTISSQELVLDSFGNYRVNAILTVDNAIEGAAYELRFSEK